MTKLKDLRGQRFGRLTVVKRAENTKNGVKYEAVLAEINKELEKSIEKNEDILTDTDSIYQTDGEDFSGYDMPDFSNPDEYQI